MQEIKDALMSKKEELTKRLIALEKDRRRVSGALPTNLSEQSVLTDNDEVIDAIDDIDRGELEKIDIALKKLEDDKYGVCDGCGGRISVKRLNAMPYSLLCMSCISG